MFPPHALHQLPMCLLLLQTKQEESKRYIFSKLFSNTFVKYCFCIHSWKRLEHPFLSVIEKSRGCVCQRHIKREEAKLQYLNIVKLFINNNQSLKKKSHSTVSHLFRGRTSSACLFNAKLTKSA